jgi:hypothetical protein
LSFCAPPRIDVLPLGSTWNETPGTVSANSRKLRVICGTFSICSRDTVVPTSDVRTSLSRRPSTVISCIGPSTVAVASPAVRSSIAVEATLRVTTCSVPAPAPTRYVPGGNPANV